MYGSLVTNPCETILPSAATKRDGSPVYDVSICSFFNNPLPTKTSRYVALSNASTGVFAEPTSATLAKFHDGSPQKKISGFFAYQAMTALVGCAAEEPICSSVAPNPSRMLSSEYNCAVTDWNSTAAPPAPSSALTPVVPSGPE